MADARFGPYRLEALLGRGGMGEVFRAFDTEFERVVALKRLAPHLADDPEFRTRFTQEARLAARLRNPHIITIHRFGELDDHLFIDMRFVHGFDVADLIKAVGPLPPERAVTLVGQVASALDTAHAAGLVHRDVKPSNLLLDREVGESLGDFVFLADFGITRATSTTRSYSLTRTGALLGSLDYMAPEQFDGMADKRVDIYALTCVLFELLTGQRPYHGSGLPALMHAHLNVAPPAPSEFDDTLGTALDEVVRRGMAKKRDDRFASAGELAAAARAALPAAGATKAADGGSRTERAFRAAEYAYVSERKLRDRVETSGRHVLDETGSDGPTLHSDGDGDGDGDGGPTLHETGVGPTDVEAAPASAETERSTGPGADPGATVPSAAAPTVPSRPTDTLAAVPRGAVDPRAGATRGGSRPWGRAAASAVAVVAVLVLVVVLVSRSAGAPTGTAPTASGAASTAAGPADPTPAAPGAPASTGKPAVRAVVPVGGGPQGVAVSADGERVFVADVGTRALSILHLASGAPTTTVPLSGTPRYVTVDPDGRAFVSMYSGDGADSSVAVLAPDETVSAVLPSGPQPYALAVAPTGTVFVPNHGAATVSILDPRTQRFGPSIAVEPNPHGVAFSGSQNRAYTANHESDSVSVIDLGSNAVVATVGVGRSPHSVAVSGDGRLLAAANYDDATVSLVDTGTDQVIATVPAGPTPQQLAFSADGAHVYVVNEEAGTLTAVDVAGRAITATVPVGKSPRYVAATPDGSTLVVSNSDDGTVTLLSAT